MGYSVRHGDWRLTHWGLDGAGGLELYDVARDKEGFYNLAAEAEHSPTVDRLSGLLKQGFPKISRSH